ncbi:MAG: site-specific DNA-methyltransferase [Alcaligenaceae bacterium]|nr:MAG: site-specific DNA-methyltransferase [Alcaligenaceae bacterium]
MTSNETVLERALKELANIVEQRRAIGLRLTQATRKEREHLLDAHRAIKEDEYMLGKQIAELKLDSAHESGKKKQIEVATHRFRRLSSRLKHSDWLLWTRSIWKFKDMESDAKQGLHPAQFSAKVPERLILMYSFLEEVVLDPFIGSGTTSNVACRLGRNSIGLDINPVFVELSRSLLQSMKYKSTTHGLLVEDARDMASVADSSIQLIVTHPPYWNCVKISELANDLSNCGNDSYPQFLIELTKVLKECLRVLQKDRVAAFMIGDILRKVDGITRLFPLHSDFITIAQNVGFIPWDIYIVETKMRDSSGMPMMGTYPYPHKLFSQFSHNYIVVLRKPADN